MAHDDELLGQAGVRALGCLHGVEDVVRVAWLCEGGVQDGLSVGGVGDAEALVVGRDDDVAGLGEGEGRHEVVPDVADVGGGALGEDAGEGVRPGDEGVGVVGGGEVPRGVGEEDGCGGGDEGAVEGGGLVEDAGEGGERGEGVERGVGGFVFEERAGGEG